MKRHASLFIALAAIATFALVAWYFSGKPAEPAAATPAVPTAPIPTPADNAAPTNTIPVSNTTSEQVTQWIADSSSGDAAKRAAAITALAGAPRSEALPVLGRILINGEAQMDRPLALRSLRDLALNQGDADGRIRDAVRKAIYHGDDLTATAEVQEVLEIIEESEMK